FLRSYENLVKRSKDAPKLGADDRVRGSAKGNSSANAGAKKAENGAKTGPQTSRGGRGPAPPEFRDQYKEFTEEQSKQAKPEDKFENHVEDTISAGAGLCDREVVEATIRAAPAAIRQLIDWGTHFDLEDGQLALTREGGHSHSRIVHALGDATGFEVMRAIIA